jgi:hypothetical protein
MHAVSAEQLAGISRGIALRMVSMSGLDCSSVALDMTNFAAFTRTGNGKAPIARRGKAKQKRCDLRLVGLGLVVTRDGGILSRPKIGSGSWPAVSSWRQAARLYSLISPFSMDFRRIRWTSRLTALTPGASHS